VTDLAHIVGDARRLEAFKAFLSARGCEVMVPTNPYEILRFKRHGRTNVVYRKGSGKRGYLVTLFRQWLDREGQGRELAERAKRELRGKNLACWCPLDGPCHADALLEVANR